MSRICAARLPLVHHDCSISAQIGPNFDRCCPEFDHFGLDVGQIRAKLPKVGPMSAVFVQVWLAVDTICPSLTKMPSSTMCCTIWPKLGKIGPKFDQCSAKLGQHQAKFGPKPVGQLRAENDQRRSKFGQHGSNSGQLWSIVVHT